MVSLILALSILSVASAQALNCTLKGYDVGKNPAFYFNNSTISSATACKSACTAQTVAPAKCASFAFGTPATGPVCLLYNVTVTGNVLPVPSSNYTFYDAGCPL